MYIGLESTGSQPAPSVLARVPVNDDVHWHLAALAELENKRSRNARARATQGFAGSAICPGFGLRAQRHTPRLGTVDVDGCTPENE